MHSLLFSCLMVLVRNSSVVLNSSGKAGIFVLFLILGRKFSVFNHWVWGYLWVFNDILYYNEEFGYLDSCLSKIFVKISAIISSNILFPIYPFSFLDFQLMVSHRSLKSAFLPCILFLLLRLIILIFLFSSLLICFPTCSNLVLNPHYIFYIWVIFFNSRI
jgi:hypothetical protein